jgi:hypothetical protein
MKISFLIGIDLKIWLKILTNNHYPLSKKYTLDILIHFGFSLLNSLIAFFERSLFHHKIEQTQISLPPIFILGHWRSGTTHLQYTMSQDPEIYSPSTYEVLFPHTFLITRKIGSLLLSPFVPKKRPQDNMEGSLNHPNEDEIALAVMTGLSPYLAWPFPQEEKRFLNYISFINSSAKDKDEWKNALLYFVKKLTFAHPNKRLLFKSPAHTARMDLIKEVFPNALFIHISRKPEKVFKSSLYLYQTWEKSYAFLQKPTNLKYEKRIVDIYQLLYEAYLEQLPHHKVYKLSYEEFIITPLSELENLYTENMLNLSATTLSIFKNYLDKQSSYQVLNHDKSSNLDPDSMSVLTTIYLKTL